MTLFTTLLRPPNTAAPQRLLSGLNELDRVLGPDPAGFLRGGTYLLSGDPGAGKSTLLLQVAAAVASSVAYVTAEEAVPQVQDRATRLSVQASPVRLAATCDLTEALEALTADPPTLLVLDSIQTLALSTSTCSPGSPTTAVAALRAARAFAQAHDTTIVVVCHVNKASRAAGPNTLQHEVDAVLHLEVRSTWRALRATKNRYGSTAEVGLFEMTATGLRSIT